MPEPQVFEKAQRTLEDNFGDVLAAPYQPGKAEMAHYLLSELKLSQRQSFETIDELERRGVVRYEPSPAVARRIHRSPTARSRTSPTVGRAGQPVQNERTDAGVWRIGTGQREHRRP